LLLGIVPFAMALHLESMVTPWMENGLDCKRHSLCAQKP
jgi:hypothetical protein